MKTVLSSEIGTYVFCQRAWWYQQSGYPQENLDALASGKKVHERHGRSLVLNRYLIAAGLIFLFLGILLTFIYASSLIF